MIRALIFDCFGVLYSDGKDYIANLCPPDKKDELRSLYLQTDYGYMPIAEFISQVAVLVGVDEAELQAIIDKKYVRNQPIFDYIRSKKADFKIGLLSNVNVGFFDSLITKEEQAELFDEAVPSSLVGAVKPAAAIYEIAAERLGILPDECIMIDDIPANVDGASAVGMHSLLFTTNHQLETDINRLVETHNA